MAHSGAASAAALYDRRSVALINGAKYPYCASFGGVEVRNDSVLTWRKLLTDREGFAATSVPAAILALTSAS
jgi:hypothetical protein